MKTILEDTIGLKEMSFNEATLIEGGIDIDFMDYFPYPIGFGLLQRVVNALDSLSSKTYYGGELEAAVCVG